MLEFLYRWAAEGADAGVLPSALRHPFLVRALVVALAIAPLMGSVSPLVVSRRLAFFSSAVGHSALAGVAVGLLLGEQLERVYAGTFGFSLLLGLGVTYARGRARLPPDTVIGVFLSFSLGLGICLLVVVTRRFDVHQVEAVLFGSLVTVTEVDVLVVLLMGAAVLAVVAPLFNGLLAETLDPSLARARRLFSRAHEYAFMLTLSLLIAASIKIVGALLVEALAVVPAAAARNLARGLPGYLGWSIVFALAGTLGGLVVSIAYPVPSGAAIVLALSAVFLVTLVAGRILPAGGSRS